MGLLISCPVQDVVALYCVEVVHTLSVVNPHPDDLHFLERLGSKTLFKGTQIQRVVNETEI